jgi:serine/threonine-protein kinase
MIDFRVLGSLDLRGPDGGEVLSVLSQPKRTAFLAYLGAAEPGAFHRRDVLVGLFWPELDQDRARAALRKSLHFLRQSLGEDVLQNRGDESVGLDPDLIRVDVRAFRVALEAGEFETALEIYRGDFLEGFFLSGCPEFEEWVEGERRRLRERASGAAWSLAHQLLGAGRVNDGERAAQRALTLVPTDESEARRFFLALAGAGDRAAAVHFFERFAEGIRRELDLEPSPETLAALEEIRSPGGGSAPSIEGEALPSDSGPPTETHIPPPPVSGPPSAPGEGAGLTALTRELAPDLNILRKIGEGVAGEVYVAREASLDRLVAVKVLSRESAEDPVARTRFEREAKAAATLVHPNATAVHRFGFLSDAVPYLVMQYVKGGTLADRLVAEGPLPVAEGRRILAEVASALAAAHQNGFFHRDVRPGNVLWDAAAKRAVLSDFGLAGILPEKEGRLPRVTLAGQILGSSDYLSPEQVQGREATEATDVYALGVMGYEILTGEGPFVAVTEQEKARAHLKATPRPLATLREGIEGDLARLLKRCLAKEPGKRPSAAYLAEAFGKAPPAGVGGTKQGAGWRDMWRTRSPLEKGLLVLLALFLLTAGIRMLVS